MKCEEPLPQSFNACVQQSLQKFWNLDGLSDYGVQTFQFKDVARVIEKLHIVFEASGIKPGDKVAICGRNSARWGMAFFATLTYGAVAVPILHEFMPEQIHDIVNHSEAKLLFVGDQVWPKLNADRMPALEGIIGNNNEEFSLLLGRTEKVKYARENLNRLFGERYPRNFRPNDINYYKDSPDELAIINYTSGTTSNSKGVMIPYRALWSNYAFAVHELGHIMGPGDKVLSMLPMAHTYGMAFEFIFEFLSGATVYFLAKTPSPAVLLGAFADIKSVGYMPTIIPRKSEDFKRQPQHPVGLESVWLTKTGKYINLGLLLKNGRVNDEEGMHALAIVCDEVRQNADQTRTAFYRLLHDQGDAPEYYSNRRYVSILLPDDRPDSVRLSIETYQQGTVEKRFALK